MNKNKLQNIILQGEAITVEFIKTNKQLPENLFETICAFLNRNGGEILLGVDDDKNVLGVDENVVEQLSKQIINIRKHIPVVIILFSGKLIYLLPEYL